MSNCKQFFSDFPYPDKLVYSPPIQLNFFNPENGFPLQGKISFYVNGTLTPKNVYIWTGNPVDSITATISVDLDPAGSPDEYIYFFPFKEDDPTQSELYTIIITDVNGVHRITKNYFPPFFSGSSGQTDYDTKNLLPSYGFDTEVFSDIYAIGNDRNAALPNGRNSISLGWEWERQGTDNKKAQYRFEEIADSGIIGSPKNKIILQVDDSTSNDTISRLRVRIGDYQAFQGRNFVFSLNSDGLSGIEGPLNLQIIRQRNGVDEANSVGTIVVNSDIKQSSIATFTITPISVISGFVNSDGLYFSIDLPKQNFNLQLTASWLQISDNGEVQITEENTGENQAKYLMTASQYPMASNYSESYGGLPLIASKNGIITNNDSGSIVLFQDDFDIKNYYKLKDNVELLINTIIDDTITNRLISNLRANGFTKSTHTFIATKPAYNELSITTGMAIDQLDTWTITNNGGGSRIAFKSGSDGTNNSFSMKVKATYTKLETININFEFTENGTVTSGIYNPQTNNLPGFLFDNGYIEGETAGNSVIANHYATLSFGGGASSSEDGQFIIQTYVNERNPGSSSTKASYSFYFYPSLFYTLRLPNGNNIPGRNTDGDKNDTLFRNYISPPVTWLKSRNVVYRGNGANLNYPMGYFGWNGPNEKPASLPTYQYTIGFSIDGDGGHNIPASSIIKRVVDINSTDNYFTIAKKLVESINNPSIQEYEFSARPNTGDKLGIDNGKTRFDVIYVVDNDTKPRIDSGRTAIYINIKSTDTIEQSIDKSISGIHSAVMGIPLADQFDLPILDKYEYYMKA